MQRLVTDISSLILFSHSTSPHHIALTNPDFSAKSLSNSSFVFAVYVCESLRSLAFSSISFWIVSRSFSIVSGSASIAHSVFSPVSLRARTALPASISLGPISTLTGMPRISASANFHPGLLSVSSILTLIPFPASAPLISFALSSTPSCCCLIGTITT